MTEAVFRGARPPSSSLLKFLRAQANGVPYFASSTSLIIPSLRSETPRKSCGPLTRDRLRSIRTWSPEWTCMTSSLFPFDAIWSDRAKVRSNKPLRSHTVALLRKLGLGIHDIRGLSSEHTETGKSLWGFRRRKPKAPLELNDLPSLSGFLDDDGSMGRPLRPANELRLRCSEFNEAGDITLANGEFKKSELIAKYGLLPRDLRKIDSSLLPNILVRPSAILINLLHLRVLIKHNRVLVFAPYGSTDSYTQSLFMSDLSTKLRAPETRTPGSSTVGGALPYEFRALEAVLISVTTGLEGEFEGVREPVVRVLRELEEDIDRDKLRHLLVYSKKISSFEQKARLVRDAIDDLLEADDDLAAMYLTEKLEAGRSRSEDDHTEVEMLLESYYKICEEIVQVSGNLVSNIRNTEEIVKAILDANRNALMLLDLRYTIATLGLGTATFFAALYGMNLKNFWEESDVAFVGVSAFSVLVGGLICRSGLRRLWKVQKVSMWGQEARRDGAERREWARIAKAKADQGAEARRRERMRGELPVRNGEQNGESRVRTVLQRRNS